MTPERLRKLLEAAGLTLRDAATLLGYKNHNSLNRHLNGQAAIPPDKAEWLERYAKLRAQHRAAKAALETRLRATEETWRKKNPPPRSQ